MKPLVLWARWHDAKLRLHGRSSEEVWGELDFWKEERQSAFKFKLDSSILTFEDKTLRLDDAGVAIKEQREN